MISKKWGGARNGSGRKPAGRKKVAFFLYVFEDEIEAVGGKIAAKLIGEQAITKRAKINLEKSLVKSK